MVVCPLCEHQQPAGSECEVCGHHLAEGRGTDAPVALLEGLEPTLQAAADGGEGERLADLEPTLQAPVADAMGGAPDAALELEPTLAARVEEVAGEAIPDLERTSAGIPDDLPSLLPDLVICRYCRTEAAPGERRCGRCGMRLPDPVGSGPAKVLAGSRHCSCGTPVTRPRCPACGARNQVE